jgi:hypothetical protein
LRKRAGFLAELFGEEMRCTTKLLSSSVNKA